MAIEVLAAALFLQLNALPPQRPRDNSPDKNAYYSVPYESRKLARVGKSAVKDNEHFYSLPYSS